MKLLVSLVLLLEWCNNCYLTHFEYHGDELCCFNMQRIINYKGPYLMHLNQEVELLKTHKFQHQPKYIQKSFLKRMEILRSYGGLYLDLDQYVDVQCVQNLLCSLPTGNYDATNPKNIDMENNQLYFMDWTNRDLNKWKQSVPLSLIYAPLPNNPLLKQMLENYNEQQPIIQNFTSPYYVQRYRNKIKQISVDPSCQMHIGVKSWKKKNNPNIYFTYDKWRQVRYAQRQTKRQQIMQYQTFFRRLFKTYSIIYPPNFYDKETLLEQRKKQKQNKKQRSANNKNKQKQKVQQKQVKKNNSGQMLLNRYKDLNHVQIVDRQKLIYKVIKFSSNLQAKKLLLDFTQQYPPNTILNPISSNQQQKVIDQKPPQIERSTKQANKLKNKTEQDNNIIYKIPKQLFSFNMPNLQQPKLIKYSQFLILLPLLLLTLLFFFKSCFRLLSRFQFFRNLNFGFQFQQLFGGSKVRRNIKPDKPYNPIKQVQDEDFSNLIHTLPQQNKPEKQLNGKQKLIPKKYQSYGYMNPSNQNDQNEIVRVLKNVFQKWSPFMLIFSLFLLYFVATSLIEQRRQYIILTKKTLKDNYKMLSLDIFKVAFNQFPIKQPVGKLYVKNSTRPNSTQYLEQQKAYKQKFNKMYGILPEEASQQPTVQQITKGDQSVRLVQLGLNKEYVQIASPFDYLNLRNTKQFYDFKHNYLDSIQHQIFQFQFNQTLEKQKAKQLIKYTQLQDKQQFEEFLDNIEQWGNKPKVKDNILVYLASYLVYNHTSKIIRQVQYYFYNKLFGIGDIQEQIPMCLFSTGYQIYSKNKYKMFFQSIQRQNYTNYYVVIIDDTSPDQSARKFYQYLQTKNYKLNNRIKIIRNKFKIGALGNMYVYVKKYCPKDSIVLNVDSDDALIGYQALNVVNAVYQDSNIWYLYTKYFHQITPNTQPYLGLYSLPLNINSSQYRGSKDWNTSHMRTYRQKIMDRVPIQHFVQYYYDHESKLLLPRFYTTCADRFQVYSHIEMSGQDRVRFIEAPLYFYDESGTIKPCHYQYQHYVEYISRTKYKIQRFHRIDTDLLYEQRQKYQDDFMQQFKARADLFFTCNKIFYKPQHLS